MDDMNEQYLRDKAGFQARLAEATQRVQRIVKRGTQPTHRFERDRDVTDYARTILANVGIAVRVGVLGLDQEVVGKSKSGSNKNRATVKMEFTLGYGTYSETHLWFMSAENVGDKHPAIAITMGRKTFLKALLMITSDDPSQDGDEYTPEGVLLSAPNNPIGGEQIIENYLIDRTYQVGSSYGLSDDDVNHIVSEVFNGWSVDKYEAIVAHLMKAAKEQPQSAPAPTAEQPQSAPAPTAEQPQSAPPQTQRDYWAEMIVAVTEYAFERHYEIENAHGNLIQGEDLIDAVLEAMGKGRLVVLNEYDETLAAIKRYLDDMFDPENMPSEETEPGVVDESVEVVDESEDAFDAFGGGSLL